MKFVPAGFEHEVLDPTSVDKVNLKRVKDRKAMIESGFQDDDLSFYGPNEVRMDRPWESDGEQQDD